MAKVQGGRRRRDATAQAAKKILFGKKRKATSLKKTTRTQAKVEQGHRADARLAKGPEFEKARKQGKLGVGKRRKRRRS